jgi:hypothetical protein
MWYLYLDESGCLGFDFVNKKPSNYFTIAILAVQGHDANRKLIKAVEVTLRRKLNRKKNKKRVIEELKGTSTTIDVKKYLYGRIKNIPFRIFSLTLNKRRVFERLTREKERVYNYVARLILDEIKFEKAKVQIDLVVDKSKGPEQIREFNQYIYQQLQSRLDPKVPLNIMHEDSRVYKVLQIADLFSWGIYRSYERKDQEWFEVFKEKIRFNQQYL